VPAVGADVVGRTVEEGRVGALVGPERVEDKYFNQIFFLKFESILPVPKGQFAFAGQSHTFALEFQWRPEGHC